MKLCARARTRAAKKRGLSRLLRWCCKITLLALIAAGGLAVFLFYAGWAATFEMKKVGEMPERNTVLDVDGKIYSRLAGANRLKVSLSEVSPFFITAVLAREDTRFYQHGGIDWRGILRALARDVLTRSAKEPGRRRHPTQRRFGPHGSIEKTFTGASRAGEDGENHTASQTFVPYPGKLCDGRGPARFEPAANTGPDR